MSSSRELEDFKDEIVSAVKGIARDSTLVADLYDEIRNDRKVTDLANDVIEDMFLDADKGDCLYDNRDNFHRTVVEETSYAVLGVVADDVLSKSEWEDLSDKIYKALNTGIDIYSDAVKRLKNNNYDSRRSRDNRDTRGSDRRDRDNRSRRQGARNDDRRPSRARSTSARSDRPSSGSPVRARPYNSGSSRRDREGSSRDEHISESAISEMASKFVEESGIGDVAKMLGGLADANVTIEELMAYRADRKAFELFKANRREIMDYLQELQKPKFGGTLIGTSTGVVLDKDHVLVNGEVKPVEHYMDHELSAAARQANLARYGMQPARNVRMPANEIEVSRFVETTKLDFKRLDVAKLDKRYSDMVDYHDVATAVNDIEQKPDVAFVDIDHQFAATVGTPLLNLVMPTGSPITWDELHDMVKRASIVFANRDNEEITSASLTRLIGMIDDSATAHINQCLAMAGIAVSIGNFFEDFEELMAYINKDVPRSSATLFKDHMRDTYKDMFTILIDSVGDGSTEEHTVTLARKTPVIYTKAPVFGTETLLSSNGYNVLTANHAAKTYEMVDSALRLRANRNELLMVDQYDNRYVVNCLQAGSGRPIVVREL